MDNLEFKNEVFILLPDFTVAGGMITERFDEYNYDLDNVTITQYFKVTVRDGRAVNRTIDDIYSDEKMARAGKFVKRYKLHLRQGHTPTEAWNSESAEIVDLAVELWPEAFL